MTTLSVLASRSRVAGAVINETGVARVIVQENLYKEKFYNEFIELMMRPTPAAQK